MKRVFRRRSQRGNAMVELALSAGILLPIFLGVFQFGYAFYNYNRLIAAVRAGARYASLREYDSNSSTPSNGYLTAVKNTVVYGNQSGTGSPVVSGLTTGQVNVGITMDDALPGEVTVSISSFEVDAVVKKLSWTNKPSATFRYEGRYAVP